LLGFVQQDDQKAPENVKAAKKSSLSSFKRSVSALKGEGSKIPKNDRPKSS